MDAPATPSSLGEDAARDASDDEMRDVAAGSSPAMARLYDLTSARVFGLILGVVSDRVHAEELLQDTYVEVWQRARDVAGERGGASDLICAIALRRATAYNRTAGPTADLDLSA
ncbi:hypothetical protein [Microbacterium sp. NPDC089695]|uniref:hypothetical protein n=1 Tax=Microbacterium sp. NPDC089695 TaxID=3364198 RepID=UPI003813DD2E